MLSHRLQKAVLCDEAVVFYPFVFSQSATFETILAFSMASET